MLWYENQTGSVLLILGLFIAISNVEETVPCSIMSTFMDWQLRLLLVPCRTPEVASITITNLELYTTDDKWQVILATWFICGVFFLFLKWGSNEPRSIRTRGVIHWKAQTKLLVRWFLLAESGLIGWSDSSAYSSEGFLCEQRSHLCLQGDSSRVNDWHVFCKMKCFLFCWNFFFKYSSANILDRNFSFDWALWMEIAIVHFSLLTCFSRSETCLGVSVSWAASTKTWSYGKQWSNGLWGRDNAERGADTGQCLRMWVCKIPHIL